MSDALTDIARDQERTERYHEFIHRLVEFLKTPTPEQRQTVIEAAKSTDEVIGGYFSGPTTLSMDLDQTLTLLVRKEPQAWRVFLEQHSHHEVRLLLRPFSN